MRESLELADKLFMYSSLKCNDKDDVLMIERSSVVLKRQNTLLDIAYDAICVAMNIKVWDNYTDEQKQQLRNIFLMLRNE